MSISTKRGDGGETDLMFGKRVSKTHPRVVANGAIDELNAALGLARVWAAQSLTKEWLPEIQSDLITIMGEVATLPEDLEQFVDKGFKRVTETYVDKLSAWVRELEEEKGIDFKRWAVPGAAGNAAGAGLDLARTICRKAERMVAMLNESGEMKTPCVLQYLNRLSDLCWLLARYEERESGQG